MASDLTKTISPSKGDELGSLDRISPYHIRLSAEHTPGDAHVENIKQESADKTSELLMLNHTRYHTVFNDAGFHNHIVHHLFSLYALGATPEQIQSGYDQNTGYQLEAIIHSSEISVKLRDEGFFKEHLGKPEYYSDFLKFFQDEIAARGVPDVVNEYIFKGGERADDMLGRMYSGFLHPILHLGFGLEFAQPCIVAEALAGAATHDNWPLQILLPTEAHAKSHPASPNTSLMTIVSDLQADPVVSTAVKFSDPPNKVTDSVAKRALSELVSHLAKYRVDPADLERKTAEMMHVNAYITAAAQRPGKIPMIDFFMMHSNNLSVFYPRFMRQEWISAENRARLLEWKVRLDLSIYAGCACPTLYLDRIREYVPKRQGEWKGVFERANEYLDDGHTAKYVRAVWHAGRMSERYAGEDGFPLGKEEFLKIAHMCLDSVERMDEKEWKVPEKVGGMIEGGAGLSGEQVRTAARWVMWCGLVEAWEDVPDLKRKANGGVRL